MIASRGVPYLDRKAGYYMARQTKRVMISLEEETIDRLKQYAEDNHTTVSNAIRQWIWKQKVTNPQVRGQLKLPTE